jgi:hypothetical protein
VIGSTHTNRVQMWVAESGASSVGKWQSYERDIAADFRAAFEEEPGDLIGIGILSDTDNTGQSVEAWYGDISLGKK